MPTDNKEKAALSYPNNAKPNPWLVTARGIQPAYRKKKRNNSQANAIPKSAY